MKILKISTYYKAALNYYYEKFFAEIENLSYSKQLEHLLNFSIGWSNFYQLAFEELNAEAFEIIANAKYLQQTYAKENNLNFNEEAIILHQIKKLKPNIIWFQDPFYFTDDFIKEVKKFDFVKIIVGNLCSPYNQSHIRRLKNFHFTTTCSPKFKQEFEAQQIKTLLLYQAFSPEVFKRISVSQKNTDLIFIGSLLSGKGFHNKRTELLNSLSDIKNFEIYANAPDLNQVEVAKKQILFLGKKVVDFLNLNRLKKNKFYQKAQNFDTFPKSVKVNKKIKQKIKPPIFGNEMFEKLGSSYMVLNIHGDVAGNYAVNMRMFEATGIGSCLITESKQNIKELFEPDYEIITYKNFQECKEKINFILQNKTKAIEIGKKAQSRVLKDHTYKNRAEKFLDFLQKHYSTKI